MGFEGKAKPTKVENKREVKKAGVVNFKEGEEGGAGSNERVPSGGVKNNDDLFYSAS
ncbi:conserved hypothetical protein [Ricinus communis]|uniref:Uncharacterized protein n=1 Tax=Ricinus communis TaxID=3988 RepID=B9SI88_RICCO|nr:conserved hypothetical protein [Ricinus communis]